MLTKQTGLPFSLSHEYSFALTCLFSRSRYYRIILLAETIYLIPN